MAVNLQELCVGLLCQAVKTHLEPRFNNLPLWDNGLGKFTEGLVKSAGIPDITGEEFAAGALRAIGIGKDARPGGLYKAPRRVQIEQHGRTINVKSEAAL